jgi:hypothetical protein
MAEETYRDYLAARVLTENKPVGEIAHLAQQWHLTRSRSHIGFCRAHSRSMSTLQNGWYIQRQTLEFG